MVTNGYMPATGYHSKTITTNDYHAVDVAAVVSSCDHLTGSEQANLLARKLLGLQTTIIFL